MTNEQEKPAEKYKNKIISTGTSNISECISHCFTDYSI